MMEHTDSSSALMLLQYGDSDEESVENSFEEPAVPEAGDLRTSVDARRRRSVKSQERLSPSRRISDESFGAAPGGGFISDEDGEHQMPEIFRKRPHDDIEGDKEPVVPIKIMDVSSKMAPAVSTPDNNSNSSIADSQHSKSSTRPTKKPKPALVSYVREHESGSESETSEESEVEEVEEEQVEPGAAVPKVVKQDNDNIQIPPEPPGKCPKDLQDKITELYMRMKQQGFDTNKQIQNLTSFRNPSIYEKLIQMHHIDEKGSNFPLDIYDPHIWGKESYYDELDKTQKKDMERREKERKAKVEFVSGTKKSSSTTAIDNYSGDDKKRKSKWDALPTGLPQGGGRSLSAGPAAANLTSSATGTRATVISAVGTLTKKNTFSIINQVTK